MRASASSRTGLIRPSSSAGKTGSATAGYDGAVELTDLINRGRAGDAAANEQAVRQLYRELKKIAAGELRRHGGHTLNTTAVVHEAWAKLAMYEAGPLEDRRHYLALAARAMRQVVVDHARAQGALKRGGDIEHVDLEAVVAGTLDPRQRWLELDSALTRLAASDERAARIVEWHVFGGMTFVAIAEALQVSERTVRGDWTFARAWLSTELGAA
jgi:RNA polymerase sigma factor (TIGR02999 family)